MKDNYGVAAGFLLPHPPIIVHSVGKGKEAAAENTIEACEKAADTIKKIAPDTIIIISPHAPMFSDYAFIYEDEKLEGGFEKFGSAEKQSYLCDSELTIKFESLLKNDNIPCGSLSKYELLSRGLDGSLDHGVLVPMSFIDSKNMNFKLVALASPAFDPQKLYKMGSLIKNSAEELKRRVVIIASGDMSHKANSKSSYGSCPEGAQFDKTLCEKIKASDIPGLLSIDSDLRRKAAVCGFYSLTMLCGAFDGEDVETKLFSYEAPFGIGYACAQFKSFGKAEQSAFKEAFFAQNRKNEDEYCRTARLSLEHFLNCGKVLDYSSIKDTLSDKLKNERAGVFVSLKKFGELRGCIGTTSSYENSVVEEIIKNAVSAGTRDPRFPKVQKDELKYIEYSVDVLSKSEVCFKTDLNPKKYGIIVEQGSRKGLLLPDLDGVDTVDDQIDIACRKGRIDKQSDFSIRRFTVTRHTNKDGDKTK